MDRKLRFARQVGVAVLGIWLLFAATGMLIAADYFVAPTGSDSAVGSASAPWRTLQQAATRVNPGDRVVVRPGSYAGFHLTRSGTAAAPIEFFAEPGVLINQPNPVRTDHGINLENASFIVVDGFAVTGMARAGIRSVGVDGDTFASHVTIRNSHAYNNGYWGILTGFVNDVVIEGNVTSGSAIEHGIYVSNSGDRPIIRNNVSFGNDRNGIHINGDAELGGDGIISNALITGNIIYGNGVDGGSGINMDGVQNSRIENNLIYDQHASGISLYRIDGGGGSNDNVVVNNTIHIANNGRWALNIQDGSTGNQVFNNILVTDHASRGAIDLCANCGAGFASDYNAVIGRFTSGGANYSLNQWQAAVGADLHSISVTAASLPSLFVNSLSPGENAATADYRLSAASAARDAGTLHLAATYDLDGKLRPLGATIDIGAYEFGTLDLQGDFNRDGSVDAADYTLWRDGLGAVYTAADYLVWKANFGNTSAGAAGLGEWLPRDAIAIPEPACVMLFTCGTLSWASYRRRFFG